MAVGVQDKRLGELPAVIVTLKEGKFGMVTENELSRIASDRRCDP